MSIERLRLKESEALLMVAQIAAYPLVIIKFKKDPKIDTLVEVKVGELLYNDIVKNFGSDELISYYDVDSGAIGVWTRDMMIAFRFLEEIGAMSPVKSWISEARSYMNAKLSDRALGVGIERKEEVLSVLEELLRSLGMLEEVKGKKELFYVARDVIESGTMDRSTIIYRLAMALFHAPKYTGKEVLPQLEDMASVYLHLSQSELLRERFGWVLEELKSVPKEKILITTRTLICFVVAAYVVYSRVVRG